MVKKSHTRSSEGFDQLGFHARLRGVIGDETQASFAKRIGISQAGLHRILNGGIPGLDIAYAISVAADVSLDWLAAGSARQRAEGGSSHASVTPIPPLNAILLADVIRELERWLREKGSELSPSKKAEAIQKIYEYVLEEAGENSAETRSRDIRKLLKLVV